MVGTKFVSLYKLQPSYFNTLFNFVGAFSTVIVSNAIIMNNAITTTLNNIPLYGQVILIFRSQTSGSISFSGLNFNNNSNFALTSAEVGVVLVFGGSTSNIQSSTI